MHLRSTTLLALLAVPLLSTACVAGGPRSAAPDPAGGLARAPRVPGASGRYSIRRTPGDERVSLEAALDALASADVIFLGELHDNTEGHAVQLALTEGIARRRGEIILSMEMLERDAQRRVNLYLDGFIDRAHFVDGTRLWGNWAKHYEPAFEFARLNGFEVVAGNVYRPLASRVAREGVLASLGDPWGARTVTTADGEYKERFEEVMGQGSHGRRIDVDRVFGAQCLKDATMAESIAEALARRGADAPPVVHWNGRFHSDFGLGTVERLRLRRPDLNMAVVSMTTSSDLGRDLEPGDLDAGHFVVVVPPEG